MKVNKVFDIKYGGGPAQYRDQKIREYEQQRSSLKRQRVRLGIALAVGIVFDLLLLSGKLSGLLMDFLLTFLK